MNILKMYLRFRLTDENLQGLAMAYIHKDSPITLTKKTTTVAVFVLKIGIYSKKVCYKVSLCENFHRQSCKAFTDLSNRAQWLVGDVPFYLKFWAKVTHPIQKLRLPIDIRL